MPAASRALALGGLTLLLLTVVALVHSPIAWAKPDAQTACWDRLTFVADATIPDGTVLQPGQKFTKVWRVQMDKPCEWPGGVLRYVSGDAMSAPTAVIVPKIAYGHLYDVAVNMVAPATSGAFSGKWALNQPDGTDLNLWVVISVGSVVPPTPIAPAPGPSIQFWADRSSLNVGECTVLHWDVDGVQAVYLNGQGAIGHDTRQICPTTTTMYQLRVIAGGQESVRGVNIAVTGAPQHDPVVNFWADRAEMNEGECTNLHWDSQYIQAIYLNDQGVVGSDTRGVCPNQTTTYQLRAVANNQEIRRSVTITIRGGGGGDPVIKFWSDRYEITEGECTRLRWDVNNVRSVRLNGQGVAGQGDKKICPRQHTNYRLDVDTGRDNVSQDIFIIVNQS
jgi:uncharacterized Zn-binding protein involved in type VI secretion